MRKALGPVFGDQISRELGPYSNADWDAFSQVEIEISVYADVLFSFSVLSDVSFIYISQTFLVRNRCQKSCFMTIMRGSVRIQAVTTSAGSM